MARVTKTGSSRRKGDEYQDLTALQLALEYYIDGREFELFIEYEKAGSLDDVVIVSADRVDGYQIKHAVSHHAVYAADDLISDDSPVFIRKFSESWKKLAVSFEGKQLSLHLRTNRGLDAQLGELIDATGVFDAKFQANRYYKEKRKLRKRLFDATGLSGDDFRQFIQRFHFDTNQPSWKNLEEYIQAVLLDHKLGVSDRRVFADLKRLVLRHAIEIADPITPEIVASFFCETQTRYLLPQVFPIERELFVKPPNLAKQLDEQLTTADGEYIVVTGPPGCGKSTALSEFFDELERDKSNNFVLIRYYCFVRVHDNRQRLRLEAKSLRVNLLTELQRRLPHVLNERKYDFGEHRFLDALQKAGASCQENEKKLIVFLDGLDHVERDTELRGSVIEGLPNELPAAVVFVIGTQELHHWKPLALSKGRQERHVEMPLFSYEETRTYVTERCGLDVSESVLARIQEKSAGLPLYLRYLVETLSGAGSPDTEIESIPAAVDGDIRTYYEMLWNAFDADGMSDAKFLSAAICSLRFSFHQGELFYFQQGITERPRFESARRRIQHLLRTRDNLVSIFHNSFRVFVLENTDADTRRSISASIVTRLKDEAIQSPRWFKHVFQYALDAGDYIYVLEQVNRKLVDSALMRFRDEDEIMDAIHCAIEAARATGDFVAISRLGSLKYRTSERLEHTFPWSLLSEILLYQGRVDQVIDSVYSEETGTLVTSEGYSVSVVLKLVDIGEVKIAGTLFKALLKDFNGNGSLGKHGQIGFSRCAGLFPTRVSGVVKWIEQTPLARDSLEPEVFTPQYAPHLAAYFDGLVRTGRDRPWQLLKRVNKPFSNKLIRHLVIRAVADHRPKEKLRAEIEEYVEVHPNETNEELAFFAAKAGMPSEVVARLAGRFDFPPLRATHQSLRSDLEFEIKRMAYWTVLLEYGEDCEAVRQLRARVIGSTAVWACTQQHLLYAGSVLGTHFADREIDWFAEMEHSIRALEAAGAVAGEDTPDALNACRSILADSLTWLSEVVVARCPDRIDDWINLLIRLRDSFVWTTHYGFGEYINDYSFEFPVWARQAGIPRIKSHLKPLLAACAETYGEALRLKGGSRGNHFLTLSSLAARCGYQADAEEWMRRGIESSLSYGYHKDTTMSNLIALAELLDGYEPEGTVGRCVAILEMIKWMPDVTDEKMTTEFAQELLPVVLKSNRQAALELLRMYYAHFARWQASESVEKYILNRTDGEPAILWALSSLRDPNNALPTRQHIALQAGGLWKDRLESYIKRMVNPRYWPEGLWLEAIRLHDRPERTYRETGLRHGADSEKTYQFDGEAITTEEARRRCKASFSDMVTIIEKLKEQNTHVGDYDVLNPVLTHHIASAVDLDELRQLKSFNDERGAYDRSFHMEQIGRRFLELGDTATGLRCLESSIHQGAVTRERVSTLAQYDPKRTREFLLDELSEQLQGPSYNGFNSPNTVATVLDVLGEKQQVEQVFNDYLAHCQELFSDLPDEQSFAELEGRLNNEVPEKVQAVHLLLDRLSGPAVEFGERLIFTLNELAGNDGDTLMPILFERVAAAEGLQFWRLLIATFNVSVNQSKLFRDHAIKLIPLLEQKNVLVRLMASRAIRAAYSDAAMPKKVEEAVRQVEKDYSAVFATRSFGIVYTKPLREFVELTDKGAQHPFRRQLVSVCGLLKLDLDSVTALLERTLLETGVTLEEEREDAIATRRAFSHAQGWPVIRYVSELHVKLSNMLYQVADEALTKQRYHQDHVEAVWRVVQLCDPDYFAYQPQPLPDDVTPLVVSDADEWVGNADDDAHVTIEESLPDDWLTAFEIRQLAQDSPFTLDYVSRSYVHSALVRPDGISELSDLADEHWCEEVGMYHPSENLTWRQFRDALLDGHAYEAEADETWRPMVAYKDRQAGFLGFRTMASFASHVIRDYSLSFKGFDVYDTADLVGTFEVWQEGYSDEDYSDALLSFGARFKVHASFVQKICSEAGCAFASRTVEHRLVMKEYESEAEKTGMSTNIRVWPLAVKSE
jgi:hypothetical protein